MSALTNYIPKTKPYDHQQLVLEKSWDRSFYGFLLEMGTGKSKIDIDSFCIQIELRAIDCILILAPKGVYRNWYLKELPEHMPDRHHKNSTIHLWKGGGSSTEQKQLQYLLKKDGRIKILIMNTEALSMSPKAWEFAQKFVKSGRCYTNVDESSTIKNPQAIRTKKIIKLGHMSVFRRIITGSPVTRSPLDLWSQFEFLQPQCLGHKSYYSFRSRYAVMEQKTFGGRNIDIVVGHRDINHLSAIVAKHASVIRKEDCLTLPPKVYTTRYVSLTEEQTKAYTELKEWATTQLESGDFVTTTQVITLLLRLHQIVCGHVVDEHGSIHDLPTNRLNDLQEIIEETTGRNIVWCTYRRDIAKVVERLKAMGRRVVEYHGGVTEELRQEAIFRIQGRGPIIKDGQVVGERVCPDHLRADDFVGTQASGGYGITLTECNTVIYYSNNYDLEKRLQSEDRAHRIGQTKSVLYVDMMVKGTIEEQIIEALKRKESLANLIMDGPARIRGIIGLM